MRRSYQSGLALALTLALCAPAARARDEAPAPAKPVEAEKFYSGRWLEIARLPMALTKGCVAGTTDYTLVGPDKVKVTEACHAKTPTGSLRSVTSPGKILDPGTNAKLRVSYPLFITWDFWILDHADDYSWYISGDPAHQRLFIFTRQVPDASALATLVARAKTLGYDVDRLEFPAPAEAAAK